MSALNAIKRLVPPPSWVVASDYRLEADGRSVRLPLDYLMLLRTYGPGAFDAHVVTQFVIYSIGNPRPPFEIVSQTRDMGDLMHELYGPPGEDWLPYAFWPQEGGLLQWGAREVERFFWLTEGEPDDWPVVVLRDTEQVYERWPITATELVLALLDGSSPSRLVSPLLGPKLRFGRTPALGQTDFDYD